MLTTNTQFIEACNNHVTLYRSSYSNNISSLCVYWFTQHPNVQFYSHHSCIAAPLTTHYIYSLNKRRYTRECGI
jgi:hypothetical protein